MDPIIALDGLTRRFGDVVAVDDLTLEIFAGEVFGFLGHNGAGKTTTVRLLNGLLAADAGSVRVLGLEPQQDGPALRRRTGVLTETPSLDERLSGRENLEIYAELYGVPISEVTGRIESLLEGFELAHRADEKAGAYSKGMKQRLALARALLHEPDILFLDEPTSGLDPVGARRVHELITRLSQEQHRTVLLCTHNLAEAQQLCGRVAVLEHGRLVALGTPAELAFRLGRSQRLEIEVAPEHVPAALELLKTQFGITDATQKDGTITVIGADREAVPNLVAALVGEGVRIYGLTPQQPSLEDVYFALLHEEEVGW
ncbi:MAG: ABC transporter ATP-binding protein [Anaerolineae bacterium]|jgi:ABC-2 type transport system ATP-binding protein